MKRGFQALIFGAHHQFDPVQVGKPLILKSRGQGDDPLVNKRLNTQNRQMAGSKYMAGGKNLEILLFSAGFTGRDHQIVVHLGATGEADPLFQLLPDKELLFPLGWGTYRREDLDSTFAAFSQSATVSLHLQPRILQPLQDSLSLSNFHPEVIR